MSEQATERGSVRVVGTAHVSADSVDEVERVIEADRPDVVAVELDEGRYRQMRGEGPEDLDAGDLLRGNTVFQFLAYWMLSYVQARLGDEFDITPGADMLAAVERAEEFGLDVALVDRDIQVTIQRFWARLTGLEKAKLVGGLAMGVAPPAQVGAMVGASVGLIVGLLAGTVGAGALGLESLAASLGPAAGALGGLVVGVGLAFLLAIVAGGALPGDLVTRGLTAFLAGVTVGVGIWATGGLALGPVDLSAGALASLGRSSATLVVGVGAGVVGLSALGALLGGLLAANSTAQASEYEEIDVSSLTDRDAVSVMMEEFRRFSPGGAEALIDERDAYIAHNLLSLREAGNRVVAVVGAGHREGIERYLDHPEELPPMESIENRSAGSRFSIYKLFGYLFTVGFAVAFLLLAMAGAQNRFLLELFVAWFLFNGVFAFGLARLAGAHWTSAGVGGAIAWLTSVNPLLAPGWFAGYVELRYTQVNVGDIATLNDLMKDEELPLEDLIARMRSVPLFRLILVVALTNVGSMIASFLFPFVVLPYLSQDVGSIAGVVDLMVQGARNSVDLILNAL